MPGSPPSPRIRGFPPGRLDVRGRGDYFFFFPPQGLRIQPGRLGWVQAGWARQAPARCGVPPAVSPHPHECPAVGVGSGGRLFFFLCLFFFFSFTSGEEQPPARRGRCRRRGAGLLSPPWKVFKRISRRFRGRDSAAGCRGGGSRAD